MNSGRLELHSLVVFSTNCEKLKVFRYILVHFLISNINFFKITRQQRGTMKLVHRTDRRTKARTQNKNHT